MLLSQGAYESLEFNSLFEMRHDTVFDRDDSDLRHIALSWNDNFMIMKGHDEI